MILFIWKTDSSRER